MSRKPTYKELEQRVKELKKDFLSSKHVMKALENERNQINCLFDGIDEPIYVADAETSRRIFEPFFTTKFQGRGLGMASAFGIVKNHAGWISVYSEKGSGTVVHIYLPLIETQLKVPKKSKIEPIKGTGTILIIEDEKMLMKASRALLERLGYKVLGAMTGKEAVNIAKTFDGVIDLAILDMVLPDMGGKTIYPLIMEARPDLKVLVCSGYSIDGPAQEVLDAGAQDFIQKPFTMATLSEKMKKIVGST